MHAARFVPRLAHVLFIAQEAGTNTRPRMLASVTALLVFACLTAHAGSTQILPPSSARILEIDGVRMAPAPGAAPASPVDLRGLRRSEIVSRIYGNQFELLPPGASETVHFFFAFSARLGEQCPSLQMKTSGLDMLPYLFATTVGMANRVLSGRGTPQENALMVTGLLANLHEHKSCTYDPTQESYSSAQARCNQASAGNQSLLQGISTTLQADGKHDADLFVSRYACQSQQVMRMANQLYAYSQEAPARLNFKSPIPVRRPGDDKLYKAIFDNCSRSAPGTRNAWCACYVEALASTGPAPSLLDALAANPFVDGSPLEGVPFNDALYACTDRHKEGIRWRDAYAPRTTACLIESKPAGGAQECIYRTAWGKFSVTSDRCAKEISSTQWGYIELDCQKGGTVAARAAGPREWRQGIYTHLDYEDSVPAGFSPPMPADARAKVPLSIRLVQNKETPKALSSVELERAGAFRMFVMGPDRLPQDADLALRRDLSAMHQEGQLLLMCRYNDGKGTRMHAYWYEQTPSRITSGQIDPRNTPYFQRVKGTASTCPGTMPER